MVWRPTPPALDRRIFFLYIAMITVGARVASDAHEAPLLALEQQPPSSHLE